jgi:hypothetical protein
LRHLGAHSFDALLQRRLLFLRQPLLRHQAGGKTFLSDIEAVLNADPGPWMYFVANDVACDGTHVFGETYDEHLRNVATYPTGECGG